MTLARNSATTRGIWSTRATRIAADSDIVTAYAKGSHTFEIARQAAASVALGVQQPTLIMLFVGGKHAPEEALRGVARVFPDVPVVGGSAAGVISKTGFGYSGLEIGMAAWRRESITPRISFTDDLLHGEYDAGVALGWQARARHPDTSVVVLLYDSVRAEKPKQLHPAGPIVDGFYVGWGPQAPLIVGGGVLTDLNLSDGWIFAHGGVHRHAAIALSFPASVRAETSVLRACQPVSAFMAITRIEGAELFELDGQPALEVVENYMTQPLINAAGQPTRIMTLGNKDDGDRFAPATPNDYTNRLILTANRESKSVILFEPDFSVGAYVQLMANDPALMLSEARRGAQIARQATQSSGGRPLLRLYIDCAGRASVMSGTTDEEAGIVLDELTSGPVPLLGFYSGVEIAPVRGRSRPLDWTGVLTTLIETT